MTQGRTQKIWSILRDIETLRVQQKNNPLKHDNIKIIHFKF